MGFTDGLVNFRNTPGFMTDTLARRPATAVPNSVFFDTTTPGIQQYVNGTWQDIFPPLTGYVPATRILTIAGTAQNLAADRTWDVSFAALTGKPTTLAGYGITNAFAQGGNSFGATAVLGTNDANSLQLRTNSTTHYTIDSAGAHTTAATTWTLNGNISNSRILSMTNANSTAGNTWSLGIATPSTGADGNFVIWLNTTAVLSFNSTSMLYQLPNFFGLSSSPLTITGGYSGAGGGTSIALGINTGGMGTAPTSGTFNVVSIANLSNNNFTVATGTGNWNTLFLAAVINQTGTASGTISSINVQPTLTSVTGTYAAYRTNVNANSDKVFVVKGDGTAPLSIGGYLQSGQPSATGAGKWLLGKKVAAAVVLDAANYIEVSIDGVVYKLGIVV